MPAQKKPASTVLGAVVGVVGFSALAGVLATAMVAPAIAVTGMTASNAVSIFESLPSYITIGEQTQANHIDLIGADGKPFEIATIYAQNREEVPLASMNKYLQQAAVAGEDRRFFSHGGVDLPSILRAGLGTVSKSLGSSGGGSTIAMQTVRQILVQQALNDSSLSSKERSAAYTAATQVTVGRKLKEMKLAIALEKKYSKKQVLQGYLNIAPFGGNTYGVEAAAEQYFSTTAANVTLDQAASIMAMVKDPNTLNLSNPKFYAANQARRDIILGDMKQVGYITDAEYSAAVAVPVDANYVKYTAPKSGCRFADLNYSLFCSYVVSLVPELTSLGSTAAERNAAWATGGYTLYGTLNPTENTAARTALQKYAPPTVTSFQLGAAAATVQVGTGKILVMAQNKDFDDDPAAISNSAVTSINYTSDKPHGGNTGHQPGSTYKPFTLINYLEKGLPLSKTFDAGVRSIPLNKYTACGSTDSGAPFKVHNDENETGSYNVVRATARSVNAVFAQMGELVDQCQTADIAKSLGIYPADHPTSSLDVEPSCIIGGCTNNLAPLMLAGAYAAIANQGIYCTPIGVDKIIAPNGNTLAGQSADCNQAIPANIANTASYAMQAVFASGGTAGQGGSNPKDGTPYLGKTGTTDNSWQTWTIGSSTAAATGVWVGNIVGFQQLRKINIGGIQAALLRHHIFHDVAQAVDKDYKGAAFQAPDPNLVAGKPVSVPDVTGLTYQAAAALLTQQGFTPVDGGEIDGTAAEGTAVSTSPTALSNAPFGSTVTVFESNGQGLNMPDVSSQGYTYQQAAAVLNQDGFTNVKQGSCTASGSGGTGGGGIGGTGIGGGGGGSTAPATVTSQTPPAGTLVDKSQAVVLNTTAATC